MSLERRFGEHAGGFAQREVQAVARLGHDLRPNLHRHLRDDRRIARRRQHEMRGTGVGDQAERLPFAGLGQVGDHRAGGPVAPVLGEVGRDRDHRQGPFSGKVGSHADRPVGFGCSVDRDTDPALIGPGGSTGPKP
jgi:hypothetical protein